MTHRPCHFGILPPYPGGNETSAVLRRTFLELGVQLNRDILERQREHGFGHCACWAVSLYGLVRCPENAVTRPRPINTPPLPYFATAVTPFAR